MAKTRLQKITDPAEFAYQAIICAMVGILCVLCLFPLLFVLGMSFTSEGEMIQKFYFVIIPEKPTLSAYQFILRQQGFFNSLWISVARTALTTFLTVIFVLVASYALAEPKLPGRKYMLLFIIITMMIGGGLIPTYLLFSQLKILNKFAVMVLPCLGYTYGILVIKTFIEGIPAEISESADIDGAGDILKLIRIIAPLTIPSLAAIALFTAVGQWNSWFDALVFVRDSRLFPISLVIRNLLSASSQQVVTGQTILNRMAPETLKMASVVVAIVPILCVYPFLQKYFIYGVFTGAVKG
ncbi:MAG: carbohydrate ABC transporter permease [Treponema sp.]|jgi:putative aldouronate transport system permease protein|nr:carbohydrate ABC transporter permease [Treponema sp.]